MKQLVIFKAKSKPTISSKVDLLDIGTLLLNLYRQMNVEVLICGFGERYVWELFRGAVTVCRFI